MGEQEPLVLNRDAVAVLLGLRPKSISTYLTESREGGRYDKHPFPKPDGYIGRGPWWAGTRRDELLAWAAARPGQGVGGGRPPRKK